MHPSLFDNSMQSKSDDAKGGAVMEPPPPLQT